MQVAKNSLGSNTVVVAIVHDINLAIQFADTVFFLKEGKLVSSGAPAEVVSQKLIKEIFEVDIELIDNPTDGRRLIVFKGRPRR